MRAGDDSAVDRVLAWQPEHPEALLRSALRLLPGQPREARLLLARAYRANPTDPRPLVALALQFAAAGETARADALADIANKLAPVDPRNQRQLAAYWAERGDAARSLQHLATLMEADPGARAALHPTLLQLAEDPAARALLRPYALSPPPWWEGFFGYSATRASTFDPVRFLYDLRRAPGAVPLTAIERAAYVARLQQEGLIAEAYLIWLNGLDRNQRRHLGLLYNGGFELVLVNQGFGWRVGRNSRVDIRRRAVFDAVGNHALALSFRALEDPFGQLSQSLYLDAGTYRLTGKVRVGDDFKTQGGLQWQVRCLLPKAPPLGRSERFIAAGRWADFGFDFEVPPSCEYQELRLVSAGTRPYELKIGGTIWFDDLRIVRAPHTSADTDPLARHPTQRPRE